MPEDDFTSDATDVVGMMERGSTVAAGVEDDAAPLESVVVTPEPISGRSFIIGPA